jgi:RNA polymerase sigma factor (sigma-70 family)
MGASRSARLAGRLAALGPEPGDAPDRALVARFAAGRDEEAFAELVRRHGPMVRRVCRAILAHEQDAEDAFQATFLVLARQARRVRDGGRVASWLYGVARRLSLRARSADRRRRAHEARRAGADADPADPFLALSVRELTGLLHAEVDRLPGHLRAAVVLCDLDGRPYREAAATLGWTEGCLRGRLNRGRDRLRRRLARRGLAAAPLLVAAVLSARAAPVPISLARSTARAAATHVSGADPAGLVRAGATALTRTGGKFAMLVTARTALAAALVVCAGVVAVLAANGPTPASPADPPAGPRPDAPAARTVTGKVVGPDGRAVSGAELVSVSEAGPKVVGRTAEDGAFSVPVPAGRGYLVPRATGLAPAEFQPVTAAAAPVTFRLVKDTPVRGRVIDTQGQPVAGARVAVLMVEGFEGDSLDGFLAAWRRRQPGETPPARWSAWFPPGDRRSPAGTFLDAVTDKDGRFAIDGVGPERFTRLAVAGPGVAAAQVAVLTRSGFDPGPYNRDTLELLKGPLAIPGGDNPVLHGPDATVVAEADKPLRGVVTDPVTGKPWAGLAVGLERQGLVGRMLAATTDEAGRFDLRGARKAARYELTVHSDPARGVLGRTVTLADTPGYAPIAAELPLARGVVITGRLLDDRTGQPVPGRVRVDPLFDNEAARGHPEFADPDCHRYVYAGPDGAYRTVSPPGPVLLTASAVGPGSRLPVNLDYELIKPDPAHPEYFDAERHGFRVPGGGTGLFQGQWCKVLKLDPAAGPVTVDVRFKPASQFAVAVRGPDGKPLAGAVAAGTTAEDFLPPEPCDGDRCVVRELENARPRLVAFLHPATRLVGALTLAGNEKEPAVVRLGPGGRVKGRLVDPGGQPIATAVVVLTFDHRAATTINGRAGNEAVETNANGEFEVGPVIPGEKFAVHARKNGRFLAPPPDQPPAKYTAADGKTTDLGTVTLVP